MTVTKKNGYIKTIIFDKLCGMRQDCDCLREIREELRPPTTVEVETANNRGSTSPN